MADYPIRRAAFDWLEMQSDLHGGVLPRPLLAQGFVYEGTRIPLVAPQGIFKPASMELPLSITTTSGGPYKDAFGPSLLQYKYRGVDPDHRDNCGLRELMHRREPLVYLHALVQGKYLAVWPVFVVEDDRASLTFSVAVDDALAVRSGATVGTQADESLAAVRRYITATVKRRIHQAAFRERVIDAYRNQCALCRLKHQELLDAAHIIPDSDPDGEPVVQNGIALCKIHHAAFDHFFLSIRPDYRIEIRRDVMVERDGPMLKHGLQGLDGQQIELPSQIRLRPSVRMLEQRHQKFLEFGAGGTG
jgi:putative restriction endonuclease